MDHQKKVLASQVPHDDRAEEGSHPLSSMHCRSPWSPCWTALAIYIYRCKVFLDNITINILSCKVFLETWRAARAKRRGARLNSRAPSRGKSARIAMPRRAARAACIHLCACAKVRLACIAMPKLLSREKNRNTCCVIILSYVIIFVAQSPRAP